MADGGDPSSSLASSRTRSGNIRPASRTSSFGVSLQRRQSASERINEILEAARERADGMTSGSASPQTVASPGPLPRQLSLPSQATIEEDADETTNLVSAAGGSGYQAIDAFADGAPPRPRKSVYKRDSQHDGDAGHDAPDGAAGADGALRSNTTSSQTQSDKSWKDTLLGNFQSLELENRGSVARDHLALERTFLAWLRTSLSFASIGIAVTQLFRLNTSLQNTNPAAQSDTLRHMGRPLGVTFLAISIMILLLGYRRYFHAQAWVIKGKFPASRGTIMIVSAVALLIMALSLVVVIVIHHSND